MEKKDEKLKKKLQNDKEKGKKRGKVKKIEKKDAKRSAICGVFSKSGKNGGVSAEDILDRQSRWQR